MHVHHRNDLEGIKDISRVVDESNYYSMLLVYYSRGNDFWIKCANAIDLNHKFKYFLAIRTYSISPEYFAMMYKSFNEIQKDRIMFNIVAGDIHDHESSVDDLVVSNEEFRSIENRIDYTRAWMEKLSSLLSHDEMPEIVMSGKSPKTLESASMHADYNLSMIDDYIASPEKFSMNKKRMVCAAIVIRPTFEEAEEVVDSIELKHQKRWTLFGTEDQIVEKIKDLKNIGVTDLLLRCHNNDTEYNLIHQFVKKHKGFIE